MKLHLRFQSEGAGGGGGTELCPGGMTPRSRSPSLTDACLSLAVDHPGLGSSRLCPNLVQSLPLAAIGKMGADQSAELVWCLPLTLSLAEGREVLSGKFLELEIL